MIPAEGLAQFGAKSSKSTHIFGNFVSDRTSERAFADALDLNLRDLLCLLLRKFGRQHVDLLDGGWLREKLRSFLLQGGGYAA